MGPGDDFVHERNAGEAIRSYTIEMYSVTKKTLRESATQP